MSVKYYKHNADDIKVYSLCLWKVYDDLTYNTYYKGHWHRNGKGWFVDDLSNCTEITEEEAFIWIMNHE